MPTNNRTNETIEKEKTMSDEIIKPIKFADELNVRPQYIYAQIREGKLKSHKCTCGGTYLLRSEIVEWMNNRKKKSS